MNSSKASKAAPKHKSKKASPANAQNHGPPSHRRPKVPPANRTANNNLPLVDDLDEFSAPPIAGKAHPREAMDEMVPTLDDSDRMFRHHPNEPMSESFSFDPDVADAAADLAGDLGSEYLEGATRGQDMSDIIAGESDRDEETAYLLEDLGPEEEQGESEEDIEAEDVDDQEDEDEFDEEREEA